jgi:DNA-binding winged helix-turn-helix (wHTH) protein
MAKPPICIEDPARANTLADGCRRLVGNIRQLADAIEAFAMSATAATREPSPPVGHVVSFPPFHLDLANEALWRGDTRVPLRAKPFRILRYLVERPHRLVTREELVLAIWGEVVTSDSLLRTHIHKLRQAVGQGVIETHSGRGYRFVAPVTRGDLRSFSARSRTTGRPPPSSP